MLSALLLIVAWLNGGLMTGCGSTKGYSTMFSLVILLMAFWAFIEGLLLVLYAAMVWVE